MYLERRGLNFNFTLIMSRLSPIFVFTKCCTILHLQSIARCLFREAVAPHVIQLFPIRAYIKELHLVSHHTPVPPFSTKKEEKRKEKQRVLKKTFNYMYIDSSVHSLCFQIQSTILMYCQGCTCLHPPNYGI